MSPLTLNSKITVLAVRFIAAWRGAWLVEAEIDLDPGVAFPSGSVTLNVFDQNLVGTVDPNGSGTFAERNLVRIVAGAGGWSSTTKPRAFHNDANVTAASVINATAAEVGETVAEAPTTQLGVDYVRTAGPASRVLAGLDWFVDFAGQTHVASRPTATVPSDIEVLDYDPLTRTLELGAVTSLVVPGMSFTDANGRWNGALVVRDVEQSFAAGGASHATALCGTSASSQGPRELLDRFVLEVVRPQYLKTYPYRIVDQGADGRLTLQAVKKVDGVPDTVLISAWPGVAGASSTFDVTKGDLVVLGFRQGDPSNPLVVSYSPDLVPLTTVIDVVTTLKLGKNATNKAAREDRVLARLAEVEKAFNAHVHATAGTGSPSPPTVDPTNGIPLWAPDPIPSVGADKVEIE